MGRTKRHNRHNILQDHNKEDNKAVPNSTDQKVRQEALPQRVGNKKIDFERKEKLENELQGYRYSQSSKFSSVSRTLIFGIIGTVWTIILNSEKDSICHPFLTSSLILSIMYLTCDVHHYFKDCQNYVNRQFELCKASTNADLDNHDVIMDEISKKSQCYIKWKYWLLWLSVITFLIGMIDNFYLSGALFNALREKIFQGLAA